MKDNLSQLTGQKVTVGIKGHIWRCILSPQTGGKVTGNGRKGHSKRVFCHIWTRNPLFYLRDLAPESEPESERLESTPTHQLPQLLQAAMGYALRGNADANWRPWAACGAIAPRRLWRLNWSRPQGGREYVALSVAPTARLSGVRGQFCFNRC